MKNGIIRSDPKMKKTKHRFFDLAGPTWFWLKKSAIPKAKVQNNVINYSYTPLIIASTKEKDSATVQIRVHPAGKKMPNVQIVQPKVVAEKRIKKFLPDLSATLAHIYGKNIGPARKRVNAKNGILESGQIKD